MLKAHPEIQVLVTDVSLGGSGDGVELAHSAVAHRPSLQMVLTASSDRPAPSDLPMGARLLHKPYASAELRTLVAAMTLLQHA
jgi:hypothetical protein